MIFPIVVFAIFLIYSILIIAISIGWWRLKTFVNIDSRPETKVSVIVAARDEAENIENLLSSLLSQDYPTHLYEIIIVDDHSTDSTSHLIKNFIANEPNSKNLKLITLNNEPVSGKKAAITHGIQASRGELIVITDADCTASGSWISTIASYYSLHKPQMILGPVRIADGSSFFGKLQALEFMSLISSTAGSCNGGFPLMANGANVAFTRIAFDDCGGYAGNMQYSSGDDMFLMMSIKNKFGTGAIRFLRSADAIVNTSASVELNSFIQQRMRWVSKSRGYSDAMLIASSMVVYIMNLLLVLTLIITLVNPEFLNVLLILYTSKMIVDLPLMFSFSRFQRNGRLLWLFPIMEVLNAVYTSIIGIAGNIGKYEWKGRHS